MIQPIIVLAVMHQTFFDDPHQRELYYMTPLEVMEMTLEEAQEIVQELDRYGDTERYLEFKPKELWVKDEWEKWEAPHYKGD